MTAAGLAGLTVPILLATGDADLYMPPPMMRQLAAKIPGADLKIFADCGQNGSWENPALFKKIVLKFLRRHTMSGRR